MKSSIACNESLFGIMLITNSLGGISTGGRELLCRLNYDALVAMYGECLVLLELPKIRLHGLQSILNAFRGHIDGLNGEVIAKALHTIKTKNIRKIFVDGSNLGGFVKIVKQNFPKVEVCTFFHNVEVRFFWGSLRQARTLRALAVLLVNYFAEKKAVRYSDKIICLSERDSRLLKMIYGRAASYLAPMALQDKMPTDFCQNSKPLQKRFVLFVGGTFYANRAGIAWFVKHVVPLINIKIYIVGRGFEGLKKELEYNGKVTVVGAVDYLADWYRDAQFVIAPIFDGSGMKTKVAEALMYGKKIIGTPEAFSGYEGIAGKAGWICTTDTEFAAAITEAENAVTESFYPELRKLYEEKYSFPAAVSRLAAIMQEDFLLPVRR